MLAVLVRPHRNRVSLETAKICRRPWRRQSVHLSMSARSSMSTSAPTPRRPATPQERSSPSTVSPFLTESKKTPRSASRQSQTPRSASRQSHTLAGNVEPHAAAPSPPVFDGQGSTARTLSFGHVARRPDLGEDRTAERRELARAHAVKLAQKYRQGSASYRSGSDRFGCSADYSMQHFKANENVKLSPGHKPPPIGTYVRTARPARKWHTRSLLPWSLCVCVKSMAQAAMCAPSRVPRLTFIATSGARIGTQRARRIRSATSPTRCGTVTPIALRGAPCTGWCTAARRRGWARRSPAAAARTSTMCVYIQSLRADRRICSVYYKHV